MFRFLWLRRFVRTNTKQIDPLVADTWKRRLSISYALLAWNAVGFVCYMVYKGKADWAREYKSAEELNMTPAQQWAKTLNIKKATVYRISGLNVQSYEIDNEEKHEPAVDQVAS